MVVEWEVGIQTLSKFSAYLSKTKFNFLGCEVAANTVARHAEEALNIFCATSSGVFWFSSILDVVMSLPLTAFYVGDNGNQGLFGESKDTTETPAHEIKPIVVCQKFAHTG